MNSNHVLRQDFKNKKYYSLSCSNIEKLFEQDTVYLALNNATKKTLIKDDYLSIHFQDKVIRINEVKKTKVAIERNKKGVEGTAQYYDNESYYCQFDFFQDIKQINLYHLSKYDLDENNEVVLTRSEMYSDTLTYSVLISDDNLTLFKMRR